MYFPISCSTGFGFGSPITYPPPPQAKATPRQLDIYAPRSHNEPLFQPADPEGATLMSGPAFNPFAVNPLRVNPREITERNFTRAAERLGLNAEQQLMLKTPFREVKVEVPVRMGDGSPKG